MTAPDDGAGHAPDSEVEAETEAEADHYSPVQPYPPYPWGPPRPTNGMAIASMVLGIIWIYWIGSILALIFGYTARREIRLRGEGGGGMATAGIVLGWVGVGVLSLIVTIALVTSLTEPSM